MLHAYEGYLEEGRVYPIGPLERMPGRRRVIITILDEPIREKSSTWADLDAVVSGMSEKPRIEDFPRAQFGREPINFDEV
jgi:hypothetical protein